MAKEQSQITKKDDDIEIDLLGLLLAFRHRLWLILLAAVVCGSLAGAYSKFVLIPQYTSSAMLYVLSKETTLTSLADLQIGSQLSEDYKVIIGTRPLLQEVIDRLGLDMSYRQLRSKISISDSSERIMTLTVTDPDPVLAKEIVNQVAATASDYIGDIMEMVPPKIIEDGEVNFIPVSPNNKRNTLLGAMFGIVLVCGVITVRFLMDDTVQTEEDVERYLGLSVLAIVPERAKTKESKKRKASRKARKKGAKK
ncbi:YveK family protein [Acetatifactor aquisgranensis]|uniref:YveK family protein n=1 Tax=Acetatifactor aquisgranensis TaxID=2941233 RepID=UPI00203C8270|nr:Wzz/FepE/Etk N-terminal domain-containing protein [Acetatifactor aquisgranensis]